VREYVLVFLIAAAVTYLLTVIAREVALRLGAVAGIRDRDVHDEPIPYLGGLAMYGGMVAAYVVARDLPFLSRSQDFVFADVGKVLIAGGLICAVGVLDDIFELDALTKLGGQVLAAGALVAFDVRFYFFYQPDGGAIGLRDEQGALLAVFVVVATANAVNFVDGLDGLAAGVVGIGAIAFFVFCYQLANLNNLSLATAGALLSALLAGACVGFLPHNFNPARIFMGDSGSMLLGLMLSASAITLTGELNPADIQTTPDSTVSPLLMFIPVFVPISILLIPLADLGLAVIRRTRRGQMFYHPDKQHLHHRLLEIGHSHPRAVLIMWLWAGLFGFGTVLAGLYAGPLVWWSLGTMLVVTVVGTIVIPLTYRPRAYRLHTDRSGARIQNSG
jgi:UDP-GlcNAc:undecaprenyl-phosphate/decaprenyl-phosphate GlcNAc-1-phosphate transferase